MPDEKFQTPHSEKLSPVHEIEDDTEMVRKFNTQPFPIIFKKH